MTSEIAGKRIVITGGNTGIGRAAAEQCADLGASLVLVGRSDAAHQPVIRLAKALGVQASFVEADLASLRSVRMAAAQVLSDSQPIHVLINNAGLAGRGGLTEDGFEMAFGVNYVGHFLLTQLLVGRLIDSRPSRIVCVTSEMHRRVNEIDWEAVRRPARPWNLLEAYRVSKLANVLMVRQLATRLAGTGVVPVSVHPGLVASDIWRRVPSSLRRIMVRDMLTPGQGAEALVTAASAAGVVSGGYYHRTRLAEGAADGELAAELWRRSLPWTGLEERDGDFGDLV